MVSGKLTVSPSFKSLKTGGMFVSKLKKTRYVIVRRYVNVLTIVLRNTLQLKSSIMCEKYCILKTNSILKHLNENVCGCIVHKICTYIIMCLLRVVKVARAVNDFQNGILFCTW